MFLGQFTYNVVRDVDSTTGIESSKLPENNKNPFANLKQIDCVISPVKNGLIWNQQEIAIQSLQPWELLWEAPEQGEEHFHKEGKRKLGGL